MTKKDREELSEELNNEFDRITEQSKSLDISKYIGNQQDLPEFEEIAIYDYTKDLNDTLNIAKNILQSLADMYLGDVPEMRHNPYIVNKVNEDSMVYANVLLTERVTRKNFLQASRQIDAGDQSPKLYEVFVKLAHEMRENSKYQAIQRTELEKFYKEFRADFGLKTLSEQGTFTDDSDTSDSDTGRKSMDGNQLNDFIDNFIKNNNKNK